MSLIDRAATFRGKVIDHGVSVTTNGFEQLECKLIAIEIYDDEEKVWVDWTDVEENEITAYIILRGKNGDTPSHTQVKKIFNWDGASLRELEAGDYSETGIQFRVEENTYQEKTRLKVTWIDEYDAVPGRSVRKLNPDELKKLDEAYAQRLGKKAAPAKAGTVTKKGVKPTSPKGSVKKLTATQVNEAKAKAEAEATAKPETNESKPDLPSPKTTAKLPIPVDNLPIEYCTKQEAWDAVEKEGYPKFDSQKLAQMWNKAISRIIGKRKVDDLTNEEWHQIKIAVLDQIQEIPF